ncbi:MAG: hypothetical protein ACLUHE_16430 [Christensenellales bacterium]
MIHDILNVSLRRNPDAQYPALPGACAGNLARMRRWLQRHSSARAAGTRERHHCGSAAAARWRICGRLTRSASSARWRCAKSRLFPPSAMKPT